VLIGAIRTNTEDKRSLGGPADFSGRPTVGQAGGLVDTLYSENERWATGWVSGSAHRGFSEFIDESWHSTRPGFGGPSGCDEIILVTITVIALREPAGGTIREGPGVPQIKYGKGSGVSGLSMGNEKNCLPKGLYQSGPKKFCWRGGRLQPHQTSYAVWGVLVNR